MAKETVDLKKGDPLGFTRGADGGTVAVAGDKTFSVAAAPGTVGPGPADAVWRFHEKAVDPARTTEVHVRLRPGTDAVVARGRIARLVGEVMKENRARHPQLVPELDPRVETWQEASAVFISAILDALREYGVGEFTMPATPFKVWSAIQEARAAHSRHFGALS